MKEDSRKGKTIKSAFDSTTFEADVSIHVDRKVGAASISPSGRDVVLASYVPYWIFLGIILTFSCLEQTASTL